MSNYKTEENLYTLYVLRVYQPGRLDPYYQLLPYEGVRFNVDENPDAEMVLQPRGVPDPGKAAPGAKTYERIEFVDSEPYRFGADGQFSALPGQKP